ncbi:hypothetical protein GCM10009854_47570 [Saccharopolyspora halophila]|uniref:Nucleotide pyrophosphohydrolase n=1 Tax=Saccharopolyspora halophila TaxID=405551 RepID=A0ABP5TVR0_9PSEU
MTIEELQHRLYAFADERDWHQFHTPKNLAMALSAEAGELLELFQWRTPEQSAQITGSAAGIEVRHELADVLRLAHVLEPSSTTPRSETRRDDRQHPHWASPLSCGIFRWERG